MTLRAAMQRMATSAKRFRVGEQWLRRPPPWHGSAARLFARLERAPVDVRRDWTHERLATALEGARRTTYGRRIGATADLASWPLLAPADVRERPRDFVRSGAVALPAATGGTTGVPLPLWRSLRSVAVEQAAIDHILSRHGVRPRHARVAVLRGDDVKDPGDDHPPFWIEAQSGRRLIFSSNHLRASTVRTFADVLARFAADYWWVYPSALESLLRLTAQEGLTLRVPLILSSSEVLSPWARRAAREQTGAEVLDYYGQAERVAFAWSDADGAYHVLPGYAHVEFRPRPDEGGTAYEIVGTPLWNECMPLVRYRTGDLVRFDAPQTPERLEAFALGVETLPGIAGRDGDILVAPDGTRLTGIDHFHRGIDHIVRIQVVHERPDLVEVRVIPAPGFDAAVRAALLSSVRRKLPPTMDVSIRTVASLERTAQGKTPFVLRRPGVPGP